MSRDPSSGMWLPPPDPGVPGRWISEIHRGEPVVVTPPPMIVNNGQPLTGVPPTPVIVFLS